MKVKMEAFKNKCKFKLYMRKSLHNIYFKVIARQQTFSVFSMLRRLKSYLRATMKQEDQIMSYS